MSRPLGTLVASGRGRVVALVLVLAATAVVVTAAAAVAPSTGSVAAHWTRASATETLAPIGIIDAFGPEQAPILAEMKVTSHVDIDGYRFWVGTIAGKPVVDVASGEVNETAELATYILDTHFHPRATLFSGTAGAQNAQIHVGDVVVSGFALDKSSIHYYVGGYEDGYEGQEVNLTKSSDIRGAVITGYGNPLPTPADAKTYGYGPPTSDKSEVYVDAYSAPLQLVKTAEKASSLLGKTAISDATGDSKRTGYIENKVVAGVVGQADVWTEPLSWIEAQNMLYPTDAEENEATGFAFANAQLGVPWLLVRGISDSVWYPNAYDGIISSDHAATVVKYLVENLAATINKAPTTLSDLSKISNAVQSGYIVATRAYYRVTPVSKVEYVNQDGKSVTLTGAALARLEKEYTYAAGAIG
ncbi:MAG: nucleoside phosphorylase [Acidimicrobiales bacterium]